MSTDELATALHYGLTRAKPDSAAHVLAREIERLRAVTHAQHAELLQLRAAVLGDPARERS